MSSDEEDFTSETRAAPTQAGMLEKGREGFKKMLRMCGLNDNWDFNMYLYMCGLQYLAFFSHKNKVLYFCL